MRGSHLDIQNPSSAVNHSHANSKNAFSQSTPTFHQFCLLVCKAQQTSALSYTCINQQSCTIQHFIQRDDYIMLNKHLMFGETYSKQNRTERFHQSLLSSAKMAGWGEGVAYLKQLNSSTATCAWHACALGWWISQAMADEWIGNFIWKGNHDLATHP